VLPHSYVSLAPVPAGSVLLHDGFHLLGPFTVPEVPAVYASPPVARRRRRQADDTAYRGAPFGALAISASGIPYGALALYTPGPAYGALAYSAVPYSLQPAGPPYTPPSGCTTPLGWYIPCSNLQIGAQDDAAVDVV
jgi:hypothetical protein